MGSVTKGETTMKAAILLLPAGLATAISLRAPTRSLDRQRYPYSIRRSATGMTGMTGSASTGSASTGSSNGYGDLVNNKKFAYSHANGHGRWKGDPHNHWMKHSQAGSFDTRQRLIKGVNSGKTYNEAMTPFLNINGEDEEQSIEKNAFYYCSALTSIEILNSVTSIGD